MLTGMYKWLQTMKVCWSNLLVYKLNFFLQVLGPMLVFLFIKASLWTSIYKSNDNMMIAGYDLKTMLSYHLWVMITSMIVFSSTSQKLSEEIRLGRISSYLIYPFSLWEYYTASFLSRLVVQVLIASATILLINIVWGDFWGPINFLALISGYFYALLASLFFYNLNFLIGLLGFWLEETWTLLVMSQIIIFFLSGAVIPLDLYPGWAREILAWSPFPQVSYIPARALMGDIAPFLPTVGILLFWTVLLGIITWFVWKKGINLYTAAGM